MHTVDIHTVEQSLQTLFLFFLSFLFKDIFLFTNTPLPLNKDKVLTSPPKKKSKNNNYLSPHLSAWLYLTFLFKATSVVGYGSFSTQEGKKEIPMIY